MNSFDEIGKKEESKKIDCSEEVKGTELFISRLNNLKAGELGILRNHAGLELDESLKGFDLFTGIWWYLREKGWAPKRRVAWLITKLYAQFPFLQLSGHTLARKLNHCVPHKEEDKNRFYNRFDRIVLSDFNQLEYNLSWALGTIKKHSKEEVTFDWVELTNDLSLWDKDTIKYKWTKQFLNYENK